MRIAIIDDEQDMRQSISQWLALSGFETETYASAEEALKQIGPDYSGVVVSDIKMPGMDGIELARRATELDPDLKVMFITGFAAVALNPDSEAPKGASVLSKPFHLRELVGEVERLLAA